MVRSPDIWEDDSQGEACSAWSRCEERSRGGRPGGVEAGVGRAGELGCRGRAGRRRIRGHPLGAQGSGMACRTGGQDSDRPRGERGCSWGPQSAEVTGKA